MSYTRSILSIILLNCGFGNLLHSDWLPTHQRIYSKIPGSNSSDQFRIRNTFPLFSCCQTQWPTLSPCLNLCLWNISISATIVYILKYSFPLVFFSFHLCQLSFWAPYVFLFRRFHFLMLFSFIYPKNIYEVFMMCTIM